MDMASSKSVVIAALIANGLISVTKFIGYLLTGSPSMLSETYHSISDTGNQILLLAGIRYGSSEPTDTHPFGKGKSEFFYSFLVSVLLFGIAGFQSTMHGYHAIKKALSPSSHGSSETADVIIQGIDLTSLVPFEAFWINIIVLSAAFIFELYALNKANKGIKRIKEENDYNSIIETFRKTTDVTTLTAFTEDGVALIGIVLAFIGIVSTRILENPIFDAATSLIIGLMLMVVAILLAWENKRLLLGESMEKSKENLVRKTINDFEGINSIVGLKTLHFGPENVIITSKVEFSNEKSLQDIENITNRIEKQLKQLDIDIKTVYIEASEGIKEENEQ